MKSEMPTISLCVITGNNEDRIESFIKTFKPVANEVVVVRACGNQKPDKSLDIAKRLGCKTGEYKNKHDWPHVDDFAAARNMAVSKATSKWCIWADTDDTITQDSIVQIKAVIRDVDGRDIDGILMRYVVPEDGVINWRERAWRRGKAKWINPIHECLEFDDNSKLMRFDGAEIRHASGVRHKSRDERNLRILESIPEPERTISQRFHHFQALIALDRNQDAIQSALDFVRQPEAGKNEKYEAFFQLGRLAESEQTKRQLFLQALATDPQRPEAYFELGLAHCLEDPAIAEGWTRAAMAFDLPQREAPWNLRRAYYGYLGISIRATALRASGRDYEADALETNHFIRSGGKISLLHATRGRAAQAWRTRMEWLRLATNPDAIEHIFAVDADDPHAVPLLNARCVVTNGTGGPVAGWNAAAAASKGEVLVQLSDDFAPFHGWDTAILEAIGDTSRSAVLAVSDGHRKDDLLCMAILTRKRLFEQGYLFHPEFFSMFSDNWFSLKAFQDGVLIDARDKIVFEHMHPAFGRAEMDETYARSNASYNYTCGEGIYKRLRSGQSVSSDFEGWFDFRPVYDTIAQAIPDGETHVEVGVWKGKSIAYIYDRIEDLGKKCKVIGIDHFQGDDETGKQSVLDEFVDNMGTRMVRHFVGDSAEQAKRFEDASLFSVFIDGAHDEESATRDIAAWLPKVKDGGVFAGHDADAPGVIKALQNNGIKWSKVGRCWIQTKESHE